MTPARPPALGRRLPSLGLALLLLSGCGGLPLPDGVRNAEGATGASADSGDIVVVAPRPRPGMTADELVRGFLYALSRSPQGDHAIAQEYLAPGVECCGDEGAALLYAQSSVTVSPGAAAGTVRVGFDSVGRILPDGSYRLQDERVLEELSVVEVDGERRLASVPSGLRLLEDDLARSFTPYDVHFLGRSADGTPSGRLVPDRVFLPADAEPGQALVDALLDGPTARLGAAVVSAVPQGTTATVRSDGGVVTVDLSREVLGLDDDGREELAAQLVWTLVPEFSGVRLLVDGVPLVLEGAGRVQDRRDWEEFDPAGVPADARLLYLRDRALHVLDRDLPDSAVTSGELPVDGAALSPATSHLAVRTRLESGVDEIRTGPLRGPFGEPVLVRPGLTSLSWGPGDQGLWVLEPAAREPGARARVWRIPDPEADDRTPQQVGYDRPPGAGALTALRVSRDGARVALVFGGRLFVGRVEPAETPHDGELRIADVEPVAPELVAVTDMAWDSGTSLVALGSFDTDEQLFPASVAVDGSSFAVVQRPLVGAAAIGIAAAPRRPLVIEANVDDQVQLYRDDGVLFKREQPGRSPFYPG